jgi:type I restriction enzyme S subunit
MNRHWPKLRLGEVLRHRKEFITIDDLETYRRPRVQLHAQGIVLRDAVPGALIKTKTQQVCRAGELLVAEIDAKVGGFGIVPEALDGAVVSSHYFLFEINESRLERSFLDFFIRTHSFRDQVEAQGSTNYAAIRPAHVLEYEIPLPPLAEQRRIVARIEALAAQINEARALRNKSLQETEALAHATSERAFQQLAAQHGVSPIERFCTTVTDGDHNTPPFSEEGIRFIFVGNVSSGKLHFDSAKHVTSEYFHALKPQRVPKRGDILFSAVGATLGVPAVVDSDEPFCFQRHIAILKPDLQRLDSRFAWHMLKSRTAFSQAWASTTGSAQPTIPLKAIRALPIPAAPLAEQRRIVAELDALQAEVDALKRHQADTAAELDALLPAILDRAFRGEL